MSEPVRWAMCPHCDTVQPVIRSYINYGGILETTCRWCETREEGAPQAYWVYENLVEPLTIEDINYFIERLTK